ncbi:hypothetical protein [Corynebacterium argentoratense]|uniref:hypothetical protein n=1 Tax=Corynebacterium argentoratense TaxID=42817 RepID=UPI0028E4369D|nr:hypothetical protein [Corynebacterium argentoratense]
MPNDEHRRAFLATVWPLLNDPVMSADIRLGLVRGLKSAFDDDPDALIDSEVRAL